MIPGEGANDGRISPTLADKLAALAYGEDDGQLQLVELHEGEVLFEQGDEADSLFVVKAGMLGVRVQLADGSESNIARIAPGGIVGEMALLSGNKRSATVYAINHAGLLRVSQEQFEQLMMEDATALLQMSETAQPRWQRQQLFNTLHKLLGQVDLQSLDALRQQMSWQHFSNGEIVFLQGDKPDGMYLVVNGRLQATLEREDGMTKDLGRIGAGEPVGEMGVISDAPRSATVHAIRESSLVKITPERFERLIRQYPKLLISITRVIVERQRRLLAGTQVEQAGPLTVAIVPAGVNLDALRFAEALGAAFNTCGLTRVLDAAAFDDEYGEDLASQTELDDVGHAAVFAFMTQLDLSAPYILYVSDPFASAWTRRCIGQADLVLILADPAGDPRPGEAEVLLNEADVPLERAVVFWGSFSQEDPPDVSSWQAARPSANAYSVRRDDVEQMKNLVDQLLINR